MGDRKMTASDRMLFSVRKRGNEYILENICGTLIRKPPFMNLKDAFPVKATQDIIQKCRVPMPGHQDSDSFLADLGYHVPYLVSFIHHDQCTSFFSAVPIAKSASFFDDTSSKPLEQTTCFYELCDSSYDGMFAWQVFKSNDFFLVYANPAFCSQANLSAANLNQTYKELFSHKESLIGHSQLNTCVSSGEPVKFNKEYAGKAFTVSLYPIRENGHVVRIVGTSIDITEQLTNTHQLECANKHLVRSDRFLREQVKYEELIARMSRDFMDTGLSGFCACTDNLIAGIGSLLEVDWACVWKNEDIYYGTSSQWCAPYVAIDMDMLHTTLNSEFGAWINHFRSGKIAVVNDLESENPRLFSSLLTIAKKKGIRSILIVPILCGGDLWGVICVSHLNTKRIWTTIDISRLKTAAETIMSAYLRLKLENQLNESNRVLVEYDESLQDMLAVQESLAHISRQYLSVDYNHFPQCTKDMLKTLGELTDVDHAFIHVFGDDTFTTFSWSKRGLPSIDLHTNHILTVTGWTDVLLGNDYFAVSNVTEERNYLPSFLMDKMLSLGIKSFMIIPITDNETLWGVLVLSKALGSHNWSNTNIQTSKLFADVFLCAYLRVCREQQLINVNQTQSVFVHEAATHTEILRKIAKSAQLFFDATSENLKDIFSTVCKEIAEPLQINSVSLTRYSDDFTKTCVVLNWASSGRVSKRTGSVHNHHDNTVLSIPVLSREAVWGCLLVNFASEKPSDAYMDTLELMAQYCVRTYMRVYPNKANCFSTSPEKPLRKVLSLAAQPAAI